MNRFQQLRRPRPNRDAGVTLAETLVGMIVASLVMGAAATMFVAALQSNKLSIARLDTINEGRISVEAMGRTLRTAVLPKQLDDASSADAAFLQGESKAVSFYANINNLGNATGPSRVSYAVNASNQLVQTIQPPLPLPVNHDFKYCDPLLASCYKKVTVLGTGIDTSAAIFVYYDQSGAPITFASICTDGQACLSGADLGNVDAVDLKLVLKQPNTTNIGPTTYLLRVSLPNHDSIFLGANTS